MNSTMQGELDERVQNVLYKLLPKEVKLAQSTQQRQGDHKQLSYNQESSVNRPMS